MSRLFTHWSVAIITLVILLGVHLNTNYVTEIARLKQFDLLQQTDKPVLSPDVAILEIDEATIERFGQWPFNREVLAKIILKLREQGAGIIVLPMLFAEPDRLGGDMLLQQVLQDNGVIIAQVGTTQTNRNAVPRGVAKIGNPMDWLFDWPGMLGPIRMLGESADGVGVINTFPEIDGVTRRVPLIVKVGDDTYPNIAVEVLRVAVGDPSYQMKAGPTGVQAVRVPGYTTIKTDPNAQIWLRWNKTFETVSAVDIQNYKKLNGKTVIIGVTAEGLSNLIATPIGPQYAHIPVAVTMQTIIEGEQIQRPDWAYTLELVLTLLLGLLIIFVARLPYIIVGLALIGLPVGIWYSAIYVWTNYLYLLDVTIPILTVVLVGLHAIFNRFVKEFQLKQQIKKQFEHYLAPAMVRKLQKNPDLLKLGGDTRELTILFSDIRGFTPISEQYKTNPQGLTKLINRYMTPMTNIVMENQGTIDKYIGDALMAFWNAPLDVPMQKELAAKTAITMLQRLAELNKELERENLLPLKIGIGINTGEVVVGNMGSDQRFDYSILGDACNLAARLEGQSKAYGLTLLIGEDAVCEGFDFLELDLIAVKGKEDPARIFTIVMDEKPTEKFLTSHKTFLNNYRKGNWGKAKANCEKLLITAPKELNKYYEVMLERINELERTTPKNWTGVFVATSK